jgi:hypothetical protein
MLLQILAVKSAPCTGLPPSHMFMLLQNFDHVGAPKNFGI